MCFFVEKKQQNRSYAAGTRVSGASAPRSPCPWAVSPLQCCLGLRQFLGLCSPTMPGSKAGSWSSGVLPLDLPEPLEVRQPGLRGGGQELAGWEKSVGRAPAGVRVCVVRAGEALGLTSQGSCLEGPTGTASFIIADSWGQRAPVTVSSGETALCPLGPGLGKKSPEAPRSVADPLWLGICL